MKELFPLKTFHQDAVLKRLSELYDNEVDLDSRVEDLEDLPTLPSPTGQGGKFVAVNSDGSGYELQSNPVSQHLYWHTVKIQRGGTEEQIEYSRLIGYIIILNNSATLIDTTSLRQILNTQGFVAVMHSGKASELPANNLEGLEECTRIENNGSASLTVTLRNPATNVESSFNISTEGGWAVVQDLGVNQLL